MHNSLFLTANLKADILKKTVIVITGGPGFGKTALIERLKEDGFQVGNEAARDIIAKQEMIDGDVLPWKNMKAFQLEVLARRIRFFESVADGEIAFSDRGIPDQLAFARFRGFEYPKFLLEKAQEYRYFQVVFITSPWKEIYKQDQTRTESFEEACKIHQFICETYAELGYRLVELPRANVQERINFIKKQITKLKNEFNTKELF